MARPRRLLQRPAVQMVLARLVAAYIRLVHRSGRWELRCPAATAELIRARRPVIGVFWHGRMMMTPAAWRALVGELALVDPLRPHVISSDHRDGRFMAQATAHLGIATVFGSTKAGRASLIKAARGVLDAGQIAVVTPDGPRGPRMRAKPGVIRLAMATGAPIVPTTFAASNQRLLGSWDRFALALPLARGVLAFGEPIQVARDDDPEAACQLLEKRLCALTAEADRAVGRTPLASG